MLGLEAQAAEGTTSSGQRQYASLGAAGDGVARICSVLHDEVTRLIDALTRLWAEAAARIVIGLGGGNGGGGYGGGIQKASYGGAAMISAGGLIFGRCGAKAVKQTYAGIKGKMEGKHRASGRC